MTSLAGKTALITGASRGIGLAIAQRFAAEGAACVLCASRLGAHGRQPGSLKGAVTAITATGGVAAAEVADLGDVSARSDLVERAEAHFGPLDILVNNAATACMELPSEVSLRDRQRMFEVNLNAPVDLAQQCIPGMRERAGGWILNISSASAQQPIVPYRDSQRAAHIIGAYGASKAALDRYTQALAHELAADSIFVNSLSPEAIVLTSGAGYVRDIALKNADMVEPVEMMAEAALVLCTGSHVGMVSFSRRLLHSLGMSVRSLDGSEVLGDAFMSADLDALL